MEFLVYLVFFFTTLVVITVLNYYIKLFSDYEKESFTRSELIDYLNIVPKEMLGLFESTQDITSAGIGFFLSAFLTYIWSLLGGLVGSPHYTNEFGNYFFQSFLILGMLMATYSSIAEGILGDLIHTNPEHFLVKLFNQEFTIVLGCGVSLIAANISVYGMYHQILFVFILPNICIIAGLILYKMSGKSMPGMNMKIPFRKKKFEDDLEE
ncbi:MAG: hypothetical protein K8R21_06815 [Leptospira sp.]|nr:hypothetical protein [Leptospira sp.]